mmetsp:Transcript_13242/g.14335  ORF Transcript_13242/g.14335 Transcript_13242/m.14335 type:complete len:163 (+) Transcript_13242:57-545(+)
MTSSKKISPTFKDLTLRNFHDLAEAAKETGNLREAEEFYRNTYMGKVKIFGKFHPDCLTALHNLALVLELQRKFDDSIETFLEALQSREKVLGKHHPAASSTAFCLADLYRKINRPDDARAMFEYAYEGFVKTEGTQGKNTKLTRSRLKALDATQTMTCAIL